MKRMKRGYFEDDFALRFAVNADVEEDSGSLGSGGEETSEKVHFGLKIKYIIWKVKILNGSWYWSSVLSYGRSLNRFWCYSLKSLIGGKIVSFAWTELINELF